MADKRHDVTIVGAGPAGATAALLLAKKGHDVLLLDREKFPRRVACSGWVSARVEKLLADEGIKIKSLLTRPFHEVALHNGDFSKSAKPAFKEPPGFLVDRMAFDNALVEAAVARDAHFVAPLLVESIKLKESSVVVRAADGREFESRLLVLASGRGTPLVQSVGFPTQAGGTPMWSSQVSAAPPSGSAGAEVKVSVVLGLDGGGSFGFCCVTAERVTIDINWLGERRDAGPAFAKLCRGAFERGVAPVDLSAATGKAPWFRTPAAVALDMDSHVRKHTLLIGDAGGFLSAVSNEGIYPGMWSARIAAGVVSAALSSKHSQDALMTFDSAWRVEMAEHMRSPHTDIRFLLPLIFSNQPMADRMAAAFFLGDNI